MKSACWDTRATDSIIKSGQKDTEASITIAELVSDNALKRILRLLTHRLQIFLVKYEYMRSLQLCED